MSVPIFLHGCEIKPGSGLGTRLVYTHYLRLTHSRQSLGGDGLSSHTETPEGGPTSSNRQETVVCKPVHMGAAEGET